MTKCKGRHFDFWFGFFQLSVWFAVRPDLRIQFKRVGKLFMFSSIQFQIQFGLVRVHN